MDIGIIFVSFSFGINVIDNIDIVFVSFSLEINRIDNIDIVFVSFSVETYGIDNIDIVFVSFSLETYGNGPFALNWPQISRLNVSGTSSKPSLSRLWKTDWHVLRRPRCSSTLLTTLRN